MSAEKPVILAVDDNEEDLALIATVLAQDGFEVLKARTGREALDLIRRGLGKVLLIDLSLPDIGGLDVLKAAQRVDPDATGVVLTASVRRQDAINSMLDGAYDFLVKPCDSDLLRARVRRAAQHYLLQRALREKEREPIEACREFLADVMHEIKNPLSIINGYASFLTKSKQEELGAELVSTGLKAIHNSAVQLEGLVEDFMDTERLRRNKVTLRKEPVPVGQLVGQVLEGFRILSDRKGVEVCFGVLGDENACVLADFKRIRQVLANLLANALKFTATGGRIGVWARTEAEQVVFCVEDSGIGMRKDQCEEVFARSRQLDTPLPNTRGLGLGLAIARDLIEIHGGRIWAESETGKGSRFFFTIPVSTGRPDPSRFTVPPNTGVFRAPK